jgi:hypothetical protein
MLRFTIRDVVWLTVVVAVSCAWWMQRVEIFRLNRDNQYVREAIRNSGFAVTDAKDIGPHLYRLP